MAFLCAHMRERVCRGGVGEKTSPYLSVHHLLLPHFNEVEWKFLCFFAILLLSHKSWSCPPFRSSFFLFVLLHKVLILIDQGNAETSYVSRASCCILQRGQTRFHDTIFSFFFRFATVASLESFLLLLSLLMLTVHRLRSLVHTCQKHTRTKSTPYNSIFSFFFPTHMQPYCPIIALFFPFSSLHTLFKTHPFEGAGRPTTRARAKKARTLTHHSRSAGWANNRYWKVENKNCAVLWGGGGKKKVDCLLPLPCTKSTRVSSHPLIYPSKHLQEKSSLKIFFLLC